jgi:hypothetical protein
MSRKGVFTVALRTRKKFRDTFVSLAGKGFQSKPMLLIIDSERGGSIKPASPLSVVAFPSGD